MSEKVDIFQTTVTEFRTGHDTVGDSASAPLVRDGSGNALAFPAKKHVKVKADLVNTDNVYIGHDANVTEGGGFTLDAGEEVNIEVDSTDKVWVIGGDTGQGYSWLAE
jgi:hypothetical protein